MTKIMGYPENNFWGRDKARKLYGSDSMVAGERVPAFKDAGSEMTHKYPDMTRESKLMAQDEPRDSMERGLGGESRIEKVQDTGDSKDKDTE